MTAASTDDRQHGVAMTSSSGDDSATDNNMMRVESVFQRSIAYSSINSATKYTIENTNKMQNNPIKNSLYTAHILVIKLTTKLTIKVTIFK